MPDTVPQVEHRHVVPTPAGPGEVTVEGPARPRFLLVLTHAAGGRVDTADLLAARDAARDLGGKVARVLQPYRVAGRGVPRATGGQDEAWLAVLAAVRASYGGIPVFVGGRSNGARVACRTAPAAGAAGVIALAFPLRPPWRPERSREAELSVPTLAGIEVLAVSGERDPFGVPEPAPGREVAVLAGETHALAKRPAMVGEVVGAWLRARSVVTGRDTAAG